MIEKYKLTELADLFIEELKKNNDGFFNGLTAIFPDKRVEQWFKAYWLKTQGDVLMNIDCITIREALFGLFENNDYNLISKKDLTYLILKELSRDDYKSNNYPEKYKNYIFKDEKLNPQNLYDLANELAEAFMEFEQGNAVFKDAWVEKLYESIAKETKDVYHLALLSNICDGNNNFRKIDSTLYFFGFVDFTETQIRIINEYNKSNSIQIYKLVRDQNIKTQYNKCKIKIAPSKLREIESVHSEICELIKSTDTTFSDFLVVCKNLNEYETTIGRVFKQDDKAFPNIPYSINTSVPSDTDATTIIRKLIEITHKGFYTRKDFFEITNVPLVKSNKDISQEEMNLWIDTIVNTNVYRKREDRDDWDYIKKRVLLSKIASNNDDENIVAFQEKDYIPYVSIGFDDDSIVKFVKIIDDLNEWICKTTNVTCVDMDILNVIEQEMSKWLLSSDNESIVSRQCKNIFEMFNKWKEMDLPNGKVPLLVLFYALIDASKKTKTSRGSIATRGVTFVDMSQSSVLASSHVYFLGASSDELPSKTSQSEIYSKKTPVSKIEENLFYLQYQNAQSTFDISYVGRDLKTGEEFFPSSFVKNLSSQFSIEINDDCKIPLDETRPWGKLYTQREFKNKLYYQGLLKPENDETKSSTDDDERTPILKTLTLTNIRNFLKEPLAFTANRQFAKSVDRYRDIIDEYEPLSIDKLKESAIVKGIILDFLNGDTIDAEYIESLEKESELNNLPLELEIGQLIDKVKGTVNVMENIPGDKKELVTLDDLILNADGIEWKLQCNNSAYRITTGNSITYIEIKGAKKDTNNLKESLLYIYAFSLMDIAGRKDEGPYHVSLVNNKTGQSFDCTKTKAIEILNQIFVRINDIKNIKCIPLKQYDVDSPGDLLFNIKGEHKDWDYFEHKNIFDETQLGYDEANFTYFEDDLEFKKLILFLKQEPKEEEESIDA